MLPPAVSRAVERYFGFVATENVDFLRGVHLLGSVALDDYREGRSDVDFAAVIDGRLDGEKAARLARVHAAMQQQGSPHFDGFYIAADRLHRAPEPRHAAAFVQDGAFRAGPPCYEINPATWHLWAARGVALTGPAPAELGLVRDDDALRRFERSNLGTYWLDWTCKTRSSLAGRATGERFDAAIIAWGVLGVARLACTLATGRIVSKTEAGRWASAEYGREDPAIVETALAARRGEIADVPVGEVLAALAFVERMIEWSSSHEPG
jgi:hypothetical protein